MNNEKELILESLKGNEQAFNLLVQENRGAVFRHCLSILKDEEHAQDITQETFLHAFHHLGSFRMEAKFSTWLWRIARNLSLNYLKKHPPIEQEFHEEVFTPQSTKNPSNHTEMMNQIEIAMSKLPPKLRVVFEMYDIQHIPQKQIAAELNISYGTVRSRLFYARQKIRLFLMDNNQEIH